MFNKLTDYNAVTIIADKTGVEGGYVNNPNDLGRETNHGITIALATDYKAQGAQTARILLDIIDGADPATTPVQTQESLQLVVNPDAAERMGTTLPATVVAEAAVTY